MRRTDGEVLLLWTLPVVGVIWLSAFLLFPGFVHPMSPTMSAEEVAAFYRDPENLPRIRYSMIVFNWFAVGLVPILALIVLQIRRMAHRTPIFSYAIIACAAGGPTIFLMANLFWLLAAFRPERDPQLTLLLNDLAWVTFSSQVGFLIAQSVILALAIYLDRQERPVFRRVGGALQSRRRRSADPGCVRGDGHDGPHRLGRPADVLGEKRRHRPLDRRHGRRARSGDRAPEGRRRGGDGMSASATGRPGRLRARSFAGSPGTGAMTRSASCGSAGGPWSSSTTCTACCSS